MQDLSLFLEVNPQTLGRAHAEWLKCHVWFLWFLWPSSGLMKHFHSQMKLASPLLFLHVSCTCSPLLNHFLSEKQNLIFKIKLKKKQFPPPLNDTDGGNQSKPSQDRALAAAILHLSVKSLLCFLFLTMFFSEIGAQIKLASNTQFLRSVCLCRTRPRVLLDTLGVFDQPAQTADWFFLTLFFFFIPFAAFFCYFCCRFSFLLRLWFLWQDGWVHMFFPGVAM